MKVNGYKIKPFANLQGAYLQDADLQRADLRWADLREANLRWADLQDANLQRANLQRANLQRANLQDANLQGANLQGANLREANLQGANLQGADLANTVLDLTNLPNANANDFEKITTRSGQVWCKGYRTAHSPVVKSSGYSSGNLYTAPVFSTCPYTDCHPGLHVKPTIEHIKFWLKKNGYKYKDVTIIAVWFRDIDCHKAITKWRVTDFWVE